MKKLLEAFRAFQIDKIVLQKALGTDLYNVACDAVIVKRSHVIEAINNVLCGKKSINQLVEWVNVIWFTDLFTFNNADADSIVSVLEILETLDEEGVAISENDFAGMICSLNANGIYRQ